MSLLKAICCANKDTDETICARTCRWLHIDITYRHSSGKHWTIGYKKRVRLKLDATQIMSKQLKSCEAIWQPHPSTEHFRDQVSFRVCCIGAILKRCNSTPMEALSRLWLVP